jgi:cytochrome c oxidase assembly protein subunit 15
MGFQPPENTNKQTPDAGRGGAGGGISDLLAVGFGTTVAMWAVGYVGHMPLASLPPAVFVSLMLVCVVAGGWTVGRFTRRGVRGGLWVGLISAALNLLILGSLLAQPKTGQLVPRAWLWVPGTFALSAALAALGARIGQANPAPPAARDVDWRPLLAWVTCTAALLLILAGGLVTGFRAGMAVPDWPNTWGANMFLYPLAQMTGGVFYEHTHRLLGSLTGLATLTLTITVSATAWSRKGLVASLWLVGTAVAAQGVLGGFRVTGNSPVLAVVHGFFAHAVLGGLVAAAVMLSPRWYSRRRPGDAPDFRAGDCPDFRAATMGLSPSPLASPSIDPIEAPGTDRFLTALAVGLVLVQTLLGVLVRQLGVLLLTHVTLAVVVALAAVGAGVRAWGLHPNVAVLRRSGLWLMAVVAVQVVLGIVSVALRTPPVDQSPSAEALAAQGGQVTLPALPALITTAHQTNAAIVLAVAVVLTLWTWRLAGRRGEVS